MNTRKYSNAQEKHIAKVTNGRKQPNSGASLFFKGDVACDNWLIEAKTQTTEKQSFSIKKEWIDKLKEEMFAMNKENFALCFNFGGLHNKENYYIINESTFIELIKLMEE